MSNIPLGFAQINYRFGGTAFPTGAEITVGVDSLAATPEDQAIAAADIWDNELRERTPTTATLLSVLVKQGPNATGPFFELGVNLAGTGSDGNVNPNMAILIQKRSALGGRKNRGRWFYPVAEDQVGQAGVLNSAEVTELNTQLVAWMTAMSTNVGEPVILHTSSSDPTPIVSMVTQSQTATQRRRLRR